MDCVCVWVYCRESVYWVMGVSNVWVAYMYIFLDQMFTNHVHVASYSTVSSHFDTPFTQQNAPQCEPAFCNPVHVVNTLNCQDRYGKCFCLFSGTIPSPPPHKAIISLSYIKHTGFTKNVSMQNLNKYVFPDY